jgi:cell volume regulation protein A
LLVRSRSRTLRLEAFVPELATTAVVLAVLGVLMVLSVVSSRAAAHSSVPVSLLFLAIGMAAGSEGIGKISFGDYPLALRLGTVALVLILFDGGLSTPPALVRRCLAPAAVLATVGVVITTAVVAAAAHVFGFAWVPAWLLGAIVSSTDAAAVFSVLRASRIELAQRLRGTLELESGLNDPVAFLLVVTFTQLLAGSPMSGGRLAVHMLIDLSEGAVGGVVVGLLARWLLSRAQPVAAGLLPVLTVAFAFVAFGATTIVGGSGFLAVYVASIVIGTGPLPYRSGLARIHDAVAWLGQVVMFLVLGLLSLPHRLIAVAPIGLALAVVLTTLARPLAVSLCLLPFRYRSKEIAFVAWVGLRGAVPIILAIVPVLERVSGGAYIFDVVFFIVVANAVVPGATVRHVARWLGVDVRGAPPPAALLEIASTLPLRSEIMSFYLAKESAVAGARIVDIPFPERAGALLVMRGADLLAPKDELVLEPGDYVFAFCDRGDRATIDLWFGAEQE